MPLRYFILCYFGTPQAAALFLLWANKHNSKQRKVIFTLLTALYSFCIVFAYLTIPKLQYDAALPVVAALMSSCFYSLLAKRIFNEALSPPSSLKQLPFCLAGLVISAGYFFLSLWILQ